MTVPGKQLNKKKAMTYISRLNPLKVKTAPQ